MLSFPTNVRLFLAQSPTDFRKSFNGLTALVENEFGMEIASGHVFVFLNKRATQVKLLFWERDGLCLVAKRLEVGTFRRTKQAGVTTAQVEIDATELVLLLEGIEVSSMRRRKRYVRGGQIDKNNEVSCAA
jgi:transposase